MALDTYTDLQTAIGNWLNRGDLTAAIPDFITIAESQMLKRFKKALTEGKMLPRAMVCNNSNFTIPAATEFVALPSGFLGVVSFTIDAPTNPANAPQVQLDYVSPMNLAYLKQKRGPTASNDTPGVYTILGSQFQFLPVADISYAGDLWYWQVFTPLAAAQGGINWILQNHPEAYLYGALTAAAPYLMDDARVQVWGNLFTTALEDILAADPLPSDRPWLRMDAGVTFRPNSTTTFNINTGDFTDGP